MQLEDRLVQLQEAGNTRMAKELVRGVIAGARDVEVEVDEEALCVEHPRFTGRHEASTDSFGKLDVDARGEYVFTGERGQVDIRLVASNQRVRELAEDLTGVNLEESEDDGGLEQPARLKADGGLNTAARVFNALRKSLEP